ncbi:MAG: alpha-galactosidase [Tannerella sp.]|jgi:alpha-galactosidase|nr:alpha-galactosidase [Tannerella sp.]
MNKTTIRQTIIALCLFAGLGAGLRAQEIVSPADARQWAEQHFARGKTPPFSFLYGGKKSDNFIRNWQYRAERLASDEPDAEKFLYTYTDRSSGLEVRCTVTCFTDFPAVDWVLHFTNTSGKNTPLIEQVEVINHAFAAGGEGKYVLHRNRGSNYGKDDFQPVDAEVPVGKTVRIEQTRGRSSDMSALPFFNIEMPGSRGIVAAVGWTGSWFADVCPADGKTLSLKSGMGKMRITLHPAESMRSPRISLLFWKGADRMEGHNRFRRLVTAHYSRKIDGKPVEYPLSGGAFDHHPKSGDVVCGTLTADFAVALVKRHRQFDIVPELFWLDAGWYRLDTEGEDGTWLHNIGNWTIDPVRFPDGLRPIADAAHDAGAKFMVWFEPERVRPKSEIGLAHPEWLLAVPGRESRVMNLGHPEALHWLTEHVTDFIRKEGIDYYRQDCNIDPLPYWDLNDAPDRVGMTQIRHIEGLYAFWDSLLTRFPNLIIDNCASGGRRLDIETNLRSAPFWSSDYVFDEPDGHQCHTYGLNFYLPVHGRAAYSTDRYMFRSSLGATIVMNWSVAGRDSEPVEAIQQRMKEFKELRPCFYGDFYPLTDTKNFTGDAVWLAYQMNRPAEGDGFILAFRRRNSPDESIPVRPGGLDARAIYELFYEDYGIRLNRTGSELMQGFDITIPEQQASLMIHYRKVGNTAP